MSIHCNGGDNEVIQWCWLDKASACLWRNGDPSDSRQQYCIILLPDHLNSPYAEGSLREQLRWLLLGPGPEGRAPGGERRESQSESGHWGASVQCTEWHRVTQRDMSLIPWGSDVSVRRRRSTVSMWSNELNQARIKFFWGWIWRSH